MTEEIRKILDAIKAIKDNKKVLIVLSTNKDKEKVVEQMLYSLAEVDRDKALKGLLDKNEWQRFIKAAGFLSESNVFMSEERLSEEESNTYDLVIEI